MATEVEARVEQEQRQRPRESVDAANLRYLGSELARVWNDERVDVRLKKRIIRTLVQEVLVDINAEQSEIQLVAHWKGGVHSTLSVPCRRRGTSSGHTSADVVQSIRELALVCGDRTIASFLNRNHVLTVHGSRWTCMSITSARNKRGIAVYSEQRRRTEGWMNLTEAARHLGITGKTMRRLAELGDVSALHPLKVGPWIFKRTDLDAPALRERLEHRLKSRRPPAGRDLRQLTLAISTTYRGEAL